MNQRGCHRRIHATRKAANHAALADLLLDPLDGLVDKIRHGPGGLATADTEEKVAQDFAAARGVGNLGMELHAPELVFDGFHGCEGAVVTHADATKIGGQRLHPVAMAHPHRDLLTHLEAGEQIRRGLQFDRGATVLAVVRRFDLATEEQAGELHTVADAEDGHAQREQFDVHSRGTLVVYRRRPTRKDDACWAHGANLVER